MKEKGILIRADYGHIALHLREIMEERGITRNQLAKRIDARFEVVNKWYQGELEKMDLEMVVTDAALAELANVGFDPVFGARPLKRAIQQRIENPLSRLLLEGKFPPKSRIEVSVDPVLEPGVFKFGLASADSAS